MEYSTLANERMGGQIGFLFLLGRHVPRKPGARFVYERCKAAIGQVGSEAARIDAGLDRLPDFVGVLVELAPAVDFRSTSRTHDGLVAEREVEVLDRISATLIHPADAGKNSSRVNKK